VYGVGDEEKHICGLPSPSDHNGLRVPSDNNELPEPSYYDMSTSIANTSVNLTKPSCTIISVGGHNKWNFETSISRALPRCHIHTLDCTVSGRIPAALKHQVTFHHVCIAKETKTITALGRRNANMTWNFMRWTDFTATIGLVEPPDVMKMDIEGFEWSVLTDLAANTPPHLLPRSISLELHYETRLSTLPAWNSRLRSPYEIAAWMDFMLTRGNYVLVDRNDNSHCKHCSEIIIAHIPYSKEPTRGKKESILP
jgi:hypothetical protein